MDKGKLYDAMYMLHSMHQRAMMLPRESSIDFEDFGPEAIKALRARLKLSQQAFATLLGVGVMTVSRWERGKARPSPMAAKAIRQLKGDL